MWEFLHPGPDSKRELIQTLADAEQRELIEPESLQMLEGVLRMAELSAGDVIGGGTPHGPAGHRGALR